MIMSLPSSSLRGLATALACFALVLEKARRLLCRTSSLRGDRRCVLGDLEDCHDGARKSRNSGCCDCMDVLKLREAMAGAHALCAFCGWCSALRYVLEIFIVFDIVGEVFQVAVFCKMYCLASDARLVMR